jgi:transcription initiation factor TFIIIB Brf1 subunit/transcription initiation factor TFIIB
MNEKIYCPECKGEVVVDEEYEGYRFRCNECGEFLSIGYIKNALRTHQRVGELSNSDIISTLEQYNKGYFGIEGCVAHIMKLTKGEVPQDTLENKLLSILFDDGKIDISVAREKAKEIVKFIEEGKK